MEISCYSLIFSFKITVDLLRTRSQGVNWFKTKKRKEIFKLGDSRCDDLFASGLACGHNVCSLVIRNR